MNCIETQEQMIEVDLNYKLVPKPKSNIKIFITGDPGAGKSTFARAIQEKINIPVYHTDLYMLKDAGSYNSYDFFKNSISNILESSDCFIIDGCSFGDDFELFKKIASESDIILNFDSYPQIAVNSFFKRMEDFKKGGVHIGMNIGDDYCSPRQFKFFLEYYAKFLGEKEQRKDFLEEIQHKVVTLRNFEDVDRLLITSKKCLFDKSCFFI